MVHSHCSKRSPFKLTRHRTDVCCMGDSPLTRLSRTSLELQAMPLPQVAATSCGVGQHSYMHIASQLKVQSTIILCQCCPLHWKTLSMHIHLQITVQPKGPFACRASKRSTSVVCMGKLHSRLPSLPKDSRRVLSWPEWIYVSKDHECQRTSFTSELLTAT